MAVASRNQRQRVVGVVLLIGGVVAAVVAFTQHSGEVDSGAWSAVGRSNVLFIVALILAAVGVRLLMLAARPRRTEEPEHPPDDEEATEAE